MAFITITHADTSATYELPTEVGGMYSIGRSEECSISLPTAEDLSGQHCTITCFEDGYAIADANSTNGTYANDNKLENEYMAEGVAYRLGNSVKLSFTAAAEAPAANAAPKKKVVKKATGTAKSAVKRPASARPGAAKVRTGNPAAKATAAAALVAQNKKQEQINLVYVIVVLLAAFYAGMALYSWMNNGNPLPIFLR